MEIETNYALKVIRPLYRVPEAGTHWYQTYHRHHMEKLHLKPSKFDPCLLFDPLVMIS